MSIADLRKKFSTFIIVAFAMFANIKANFRWNVGRLRNCRRNGEDLMHPFGGIFIFLVLFPHFTNVKPFKMFIFVASTM